ncbi:hypothetical protein LEMLEM_LOCUS12691 [Lemmus lemmus]
MLARGFGKEKVVGKVFFLNQSHCHNRTVAAFFCVLKDEANKGKEEKRIIKKRPSLMLHLCSPANHARNRK